VVAWSGSRLEDAAGDMALETGATGAGRQAASPTISASFLICEDLSAYQAMPSPRHRNRHDFAGHGSGVARFGPRFLR
jgi:hypothetical protein